MADKRNVELRVATVERVIKKLNQLNMPALYPAFIPVLKLLQKRVDKIKSLRTIYLCKNLSGAKKADRHRLSNAAHHVSSGIYAYANITGNIVMKNAVNYSVSDFYRPEEDTMIGRVKQIMNAVKKVKNPLHFGLTPEVIDDLRLRFKKFMDFRNQPQIQIKKHAQALRHADKLTDQCFEIIQQQLDPLVVIINRTENYLAQEYRIVRRVGKSPGRKRKYIKKQKPVAQENKMVLPVISEHQPGNITLAFAE